MARVLVARQPWGTLWEKAADRQLSVPASGTGASINTTVYSASTGSGTVSSFVTDTNGELPGWVEEGTHTLTVNSVATQVEAVSSAGGRVQLAHRPVDVKQYAGVDPTGATDSTAGILAAIAVNGKAVATRGIFRCDTPIDLTSANGGQVLTVEPDAILKRAAAASSTDAVVRLRGNFAKVLGAGQIVTEKASPRGIINVGPITLTSTENINWWRVGPLDLLGVKASGNYGLRLQSSQPTTDGSGVGSNYNGQVDDNIVIRSVGTAIRLDELCNAHSFGAVYAYDILDNVFHIYGKKVAGGLGDETGEACYFTGGFTHASPNVTVIRCEGNVAWPEFRVGAEPGTGSKYYDIDANCNSVLIDGFNNCPVAPVNLSASTRLPSFPQIIEVGSAGAPAFTNSWVNFDAAANSRARYGRDAAGIVHIVGLVKGGTPPSSVFTLPAGYRPARDEWFAGSSNSAYADLRVSSAGLVTVQTGFTVWASLNGISFPAA